MTYMTKRRPTSSSCKSSPNFSSKDTGLKTLSSQPQRKRHQKRNGQFESQTKWHPGFCDGAVEVQDIASPLGGRSIVLDFVTACTGIDQVFCCVRTTLGTGNHVIECDRFGKPFAIDTNASPKLLFGLGGAMANSLLAMIEKFFLADQRIANGTGISFWPAVDVHHRDAHEVSRQDPIGIIVDRVEGGQEELFIFGQQVGQNGMSRSGHRDRLSPAWRRESKKCHALALLRRLERWVRYLPQYQCMTLLFAFVANRSRYLIV